jgi:hypothetical protein
VWHTGVVLLSGIGGAAAAWALTLYARNRGST